MTIGTAARSLGILATLVIVAACARPNADGWWDEGTHAVDGYWVRQERPCAPETDEECTVAIETASALLKAKDPGAAITGAAIAGYPTQQGKDPSEATVILAGLWKPKFVIFDLADRSRRTIGLTCGPDMDVQAAIRPTVCWETDFDVWRVTGS